MEADVEKLRRDIAHCIEDPECCSRCELWGVSRLDENKHCQSCIEEIKDEEERDKKRQLLEDEEIRCAECGAIYRSGDSACEACGNTMDKEN